jgi:hypothetical protein
LISFTIFSTLFTWKRSCAETGWWVIEEEKRGEKQKEEDVGFCQTQIQLKSAGNSSWEMMKL